MRNYRGAGYRCKQCDTGNLKLWRTSASFVEMFCASCAVIDQRKRGNMRGPAPASGVPFDFHDPEEKNGPLTDSIGALVPAIPTRDGFTFWGHGSADAESCVWWHGRPTYHDEPGDLIVERILRAYYFDRFQDAARSILERNAR